MKIVVDATPLLLRSAGVKSYLYHWILTMRRQAGDQAIRTFPPMPQIGALDHEHSVTATSKTVGGIGMLHASNYLRLPVLDFIAHGADFFHASNQVRRPPKGPALTATLHDLTCWTMPEFHTAANVRADQNFAEAILKKARGVIAVSESTRQDAIKHLRLPEDRVVTIHSGVSDAFFEVTAEESKSAAARLGLTKPYVLVVGTIEPRKNVDRLLDAWKSYPSSLKQEFDLVLAGPAGWSAAQTIARLERAGAGVKWLGYVNEADLPGLTAGATVAAYVSMYEGFGFPVAQALAAGVPVMTSNVSSLPEVGGDGAEYIDPRSTAEIGACLRGLLESPSRRAKLALAAKSRGGLFRWERCASESLEFFKGLM
jgi:alpha-1,3-rhamnosyl/mannosyltransferase